MTHKLLALCFGLGPLSDLSSFPVFVAVLCLPIIPAPSKLSPEPCSVLVLRGLTKLGVVVTLMYASVVVRPPQLSRLLFYGFILYLSAGYTFDLVAGVLAGLLKLRLTPAFQQPFLATSLGEFWGRRWNLPVTTLIRETLYVPLVSGLGPKAGKASPVVRCVAVVVSFLFSALCHEMFIVMATGWYTGEWLHFFLLHGALMLLEQQVGADPPPPPTYPSCLLTLSTEHPPIGTPYQLRGEALAFGVFMAFGASAHTYEER